MADPKSKIGSNAKPGRNWLKFLFRAGILLLLLVVVAYFVVTSSVFIQGVVIPRVEKTIHAKIAVTDVEFSPFSQLALHEIKITPEGHDTLLSAKLIRARYGLVSILRGNILVEEITLDTPTVHIVTNPDGSSNLDFLKSLSTSEDKSEAKSPKSTSGGDNQLNIKSIALKNATFRHNTTSKSGDKLVAELANFNLTASDIRNNAGGKLDFSGGFSLDKTTASPASLASIQALVTGSFAFDLSQNLMPGKARGSASISVSRGTGAFSDANGLVAKLESEVSPTEIKQLVLSFDKGGKHLGETKISGPFDAVKQEGKLKIEVLSIDRQVLNILGAASGIDFAGTTVSANCDVELSKSGKAVASNGRVEVARFQIKRAGQVTPALDLRCDYSVAMDRDEQALQIKSINLAVTQKSRALLQGELSNPMTLAFGNKATTGNSEAALSLALTDLNLADWKPFTGEQGPTGTASAKIKLTTQSGGNQMVAQIDSLIENLAIGAGEQALRIGEVSFNGVVTNQTPGQSVSAVIAARNISIPAAQGTPLEATLRFDASVANSLADLRQFALQLTPTGRATNEVNLKGTVNFTDTKAITGKLALTADTLDLTRYYDLFEPKGNKAEVSKPVTTTTNVVAGSKEPEAVKLPLRNFVATATIGRFYLREVEVADLHTSVLLDGSHIVLKPFQLTLNKAPITASADADLSMPGYKYDLAFDAKGIPIEPLANTFSPTNRGKTLGTASATIKLTKQAGGNQIVAQIESLIENLSIGSGEQTMRVGALSFNGGVTSLNQGQSVNALIAVRNISIPAAQGTPLEATLKLDASIAKNVAELRQCMLRLTPTVRATNELSLKGTVDFSDVNAITGKLALTADALDATHYYDLFEPKTLKAEAPTEQTTTTNTPSANKEPDAVKLPLRNFVADATIGRFYLREVDAANLRATLTLDASHVVLKPFQLTLNSAPIAANADVDLSMPGYKYDLTLTANGVPIEPLANTFSPAYRGQAQGKLIADIKAKGAGITGVNLKKTLTASANLNFTNANIQVTGKSMKKVVSVIAAVLNAPELLSSPLDFVTTSIRASDGKIEATSFIAQSALLHIESKGTVPISDVLMDSPLNQPVEVSLVRNLANKLSIVNIPTNVPYMKLPTFVTLKGTLGNVEAKPDKAKLVGLTAIGIIGGAANLATDKGGNVVNKALDAAGGLLGTNKVNASDLLNLFQKKKR